MDERDASLAAQQAERAKNDRMRYVHYLLSIIELRIYSPSFLIEEKGNIEGAACFLDVFLKCITNGMKADELFLISFLIMLYYLLKCSGRELFLSNASLFVDDAEAYDNYEREPEPVETDQNVSFS